MGVVNVLVIEGGVRHSLPIANLVSAPDGEVDQYSRHGIIVG
jgi:hypothetical protein